jgi:hypothetical protein
MREDLWRRALSRTGRVANPRGNYPRGGCGFTADEEHEVKGLLRRVRDGVLTRACIKRDLRTAEQRLFREGNEGRHDPDLLLELRARVKVLGHVLDATPEGLVSNPQLQVLGNGTDVSPERVNKAVRRFHGTSNGTLLRKFSTDDGRSVTIDLAYLGDCPAVAWLSDERGSSDHDILVEKSHVRFHGFRTLFHGDDQPHLDLWVDPSVSPSRQLACITGPAIRKLKDRCGENGVLGVAPIVEYTVEEIEDSSKADSHFVHTYDEPQPVLRWRDEINGLVYERDRSVAGLSGVSPFVVDDWFDK